MENYFTKEQEKKIIDLYVNQKRGQLYCAKAVGSTNIKKVKEVLYKYNIPIRNFSEAASCSNRNRALNKNKEYFSFQSHNMTWLLGFLASDGSVSSSDNTIKIGLSAKDKEILEKIKNEVEIENKIVEYTTNNGFDCVDLHWTCKEHKEELAKYGITSKKTFTIKPPINLESKYYIDFIRGYFDGDGSVNLLHSNKKIVGLRWQICSATQEILEWIVDVLEKQYNVPKVKVYKDNIRSNYYYFQYSTQSTKLIYNILYTPNSLFLKRKKDHFDKIIQMK
ncbi:MAG: LAGLIDADG family homing endonuclease [Bacilli bacterium]|nr:LAGLIDADG family homing endonuclease [Bacilli bacterium]